MMVVVVQGKKDKKEKKVKGSAAPRACDVASSDLEDYLKQLFAIGDANGDGVLQPAELTKLLGLCGFNLSDEQVAELVQSADVNGDGVIEYDEFAPVAAQLLKAQDGDKADKKDKKVLVVLALLAGLLGSI